MVLVISLAAGTFLGAISGFIITRFNVAPFIATLGMLMVARGLAGLINNGETYPNLVGKEELGNTGFRELGTGELFGVVPWAIVILVVFARGGLVRDHADAVRAGRLRGRRQRALGGALRRARQPHQDDRLHDQRLLRRHGRPHHRQPAGRRAPRHRPVLRALRHRRGRARRHLAGRRPRHHRGHHHRRPRHRHAQQRPDADGHLLASRSWSSPAPSSCWP